MGDERTAHPNQQTLCTLERENFAAMGGRCRQASGATTTFLVEAPRRGDSVEKTSLYGLVLHPGRRVNYSKIDPELSRELLIEKVSWVILSVTINSLRKIASCLKL